MKIYSSPFFNGSFYFTLASILLTFKACTTKETSKNDMLLGQWQAEWQTRIDDNFHSMRGVLHFEEDGSVQVKAYGYKGCYFMSDTSKNEMNWSLKGDTLELLVEDDNFTFAYRVKQMQQNKVQLTLLDDIHLNLQKMH